MDIKLDGDYLKINILDVLSGLSPDQEQELIENLSCSDTVIQHVMEQVLEGMTSNGYSGLEHCSSLSTITNPTAIEQARLDIISKQETVVTEMFNKLKSEVVRVNKVKDDYMNKYFDLYHKRGKNNGSVDKCERDCEGVRWLSPVTR